MLTLEKLRDEIMAWRVKNDPHTTWDDALESFQDHILYYTGCSDPIILDSGRVEPVHQFGGEGLGDTFYYVFSVAGQYFQRNGFYDSYEGVDWEDSEFFEVVPKEVTVIEYVEK